MESIAVSRFLGHKFNSNIDLDVVVAIPLNLYFFALLRPLASGSGLLVRLVVYLGNQSQLIIGDETTTATALGYIVYEQSFK